LLTNIWMKEQGNHWNYMLHKQYDEEEDSPVYIGLSSSKRIAVDKEVKGELSPLVMRWAGLEDSVATLQSLSNFNADQRKDIQKNGASIASLDEMSFKELAGVIEKAF